MSTLQTDAYQMAGQDIPWLLAHWVERKPDHPFLIWEPKDVGGDGTHPSKSGREKVAKMLLEFFKADQTASWFRK